MSRILGVDEKAKRYHEERFRRGRLRGFDQACCKLQTGTPEKNPTNRTANWKTYIPYRVTPRTRVETKFKMVLCKQAACSNGSLCSLHLLHLRCLTLFALHCSAVFA